MFQENRLFPRLVWILLLLLGWTAAESKACLTGFGELFEMNRNRGLAEYPHPVGHPLDTANAGLQNSLNSWRLGLEEGNFQSSCNYGVYLIYAQRYAEAEEFLRAVYNRWPDEHESAANLGTALEINGKNEEAIHYIQKSIDLAPEADYGSEWIHVKILEAKMNGLAQLNIRDLFGIDFGQELQPKAVAVRRDVKLLQKQLFYQLNERVTFIPPADPIIAGLLFELANASLNCGQYVPALKTFKLAQRYGFRAPLLKERMRYTKKKIH